MSGVRNKGEKYKYQSIQDKVMQEIVSHINTKVITVIPLDADLSSIGLDSVTFIKAVVAIEKEYAIDFDDQRLSINSFSNVKDVIDYVASKVN